MGTVIAAAIAVAALRWYSGDSSWLPAALLSSTAGVAAMLGWRPQRRLDTEHRQVRLCCHTLGLMLSAIGMAVASMAAGAAAVIVASVGASAATLLFTVTLLNLPDDRPDPRARLRRSLDGLFVSGCAVFGVWLLAVRPWWEDERSSRAVEDLVVAVPAVLAAIMLGIGLAATIRATARRSCGMVLLAVYLLIAIGHTGVIVAWHADAAPSVSTAMLLVWGGGCVLTARIGWWVSRRAGRDQPSLPGTVLVLATIPAVAAAAVALYHGFFIGPLESDAVVLAMFVVAVLCVRQILARLDVRDSASQLADQEGYYRSIVAGSSDVTTVLNADQTVRWQAAGTSWELGLGTESTVGRPFADVVHPDDAADVNRRIAELLHGPPGQRTVIDARVRDAAGEWRDTESTVSDQRAVPQVSGLVVHTRDVGERRALERELARLAYADPLTSLANRRALRRTLENDAAGGAMPCTLLAIDLDEFKNVNDMQGHDIGDAVLVEVARRLKANLRPTDVAARLGGDEFAVLLWCRPDQATEIAGRLLGALAEPYRFPGRSTVFLSTSIGLAGCATADDVESLLRNADLALRSAKQLGKNRIERYDSRFERRVRRRSELVHELRGAIDRDELTMVFQPVVSLPDRTVAGAEALLRWHHPRLGVVSPAEFIPAADEADMTAALASWTVRQVAARLSAWRGAGHTAWISLNVSVRQLHTAAFAVDVVQALLEQGVLPGRLVVEVTEHDVASDMNALVAQLGALRGTGVRIALDDFGSGYSSLGQLHRLPVDILKIDRDLVAGSDADAAPLADVAVKLGERLGLSVIAEGVETDAQLAAVQEAGCPLVQGYLFAKPMPIDQIDELLMRQVTAVGPLAIEAHPPQPLVLEDGTPLPISEKT